MLYPRRCPFCDKLLDLGGDIACDGCKAELPYIRGPRCLRCGAPVEYDEQEYCYGCIKRKHSYSRGYSIFFYNDGMKKAMSDFKFNNRKDNGDFFARELTQHSGSFIKSFCPDMLIPVPVHRSRLSQRGFNQAELLAVRLGSFYGIEVRPGILIRVKKTLPQKKLGSGGRFANLRDAFSLDERVGPLVSSKRVLLVDDIYTTGSTVEACTQTLLHGGAEEVGFISVCIGSN